MNTAIELNKLTYDDLVKSIYTRYSGNVSYGLERIVSILAEMGNPEKQLKGIHIGGTNGKGSTSAMCEAIAIADKKTTGLNISPHLLDYRERYRINGKIIEIDELLRVYEQWKELFEKWEASFFEITTAIAFYLFNELQLETSIFEVGLGGRLDGTNPFKSSVAVITSISIDHRKTLGDTIEKIAYEKAGIIKENTPIVVGKIDKIAFDVIAKTAAERGAPLISYGDDYYVENVSFDNYGTTFDLINKNNNIPLLGKIEKIKTNLIGQHQARNAALSMIAYSLYKQSLKEEVDLQVVKNGLQNVDWLGRMQIINSKPLTILDCAHNEEGIENLVVNLSLLFPHKRFLFVVAILRDKNFRKMITCMNSVAKKVFVAKNSSERAADVEEQAEIVKEAEIPCAIGLSVTDAYNIAQSEAEDDDIIIITGSIYTVSEILKK